MTEFENALKIAGGASKMIHGIDPFIEAERCSKCEGVGYVLVANGADDYDKEECDCQHE